MRVLYGVVGEGMGHATRSRVVLDHLLGLGHEVLVVVSGRAHGFLTAALARWDQATVVEIAGLRLVQEDGAVDKSASFWANLADGPEGLVDNATVYVDAVRRFAPDVVVSDFETFAWAYGRTHDVPVIGLDNIQILHRCRHDKDLLERPSLSFLVAKTAAKLKMPGAYHYLITSFFFPPVRKPRTSLVPPILRPEILAAERVAGDHVLVYQHADALPALLPALRARGDVPFRVYGAGEAVVDGNLTLRPFSNEGFVEDLASARGVIAGGGFSLMSEAVHLGVPMLSVPLAAQAEQALNAAYLEHEGYGHRAEVLTPDAIDAFLADLPRLTERLATYPRPPRGAENAMVLACVDELLRHVAMGEPPPAFLEAETMGDSVGSAIDRRVEG